MPSQPKDFKWMDPASIWLQNSRLDLGAKYSAVESYVQTGSITGVAKNDYLITLAAMNGLSEKIPRKIGANDFLFSFQETINSILESGFAPEADPIAVNKNLKILSGAHRLAVCTYLNVPIKVILTDEEEETFDLKFFADRHVDQATLDRCFLGLANKRENMRVVLIYPTSSDSLQRIMKEINSKVQVLYIANVELNYNLSFHLKQISYILHSPNRATSEWCGNIDNAFEGIKTHVIGSGFKGKLVVVLFEEIDIENTIEFKQIIRETAKNGKFSVHTSDSFNETIDLISVILSEESRNLITKSRTSDYRIFGRLFDLYSYINRSLIPKESFVLTGSAGMGVAGIRDISDIDIIPGSNLHSIEPDPSSGINIQKENLFNKSFNALIYNRENYFSFFGLKFVVLHEIRRMKKTRGEFPKDVLDVKLIDEFLGEKKSQIWRQVFFWWKLRGFRILLMFRKGKVLLYQLLVRMKIYGPLRYVIDKIARYF